jgi:hypothetical protein
MIEEDYLMRLVRRFASALARISGLKNAQQYPEALEAIDQAYQDLFGVNSKFVFVLSEKDLLALMQSGGALDADKAVIMAGLLVEEAETQERQGRPEESRPRYRKALNLLLEAVRSGRETSFPDLRARIEGLMLRLSVERTPEIEALLSQYKGNKEEA